MNKKFFFWIIVLLIPVLLVPPFALHVSKFGTVGIQHAFITDPPNFSEGISASTLLVEILAVLLIAFVLSKLKIKGVKVEGVKQIFKNILILSIVFIIGLFAVSEIIKYQRNEIQRVEIDETSYKKGYEEGYKKRKIIDSGSLDPLKFGFTQEEIDMYKIRELEKTIKMFIDAGAFKEEIKASKDFKELEKLKKSLGIKPIYVFPK